MVQNPSNPWLVFLQSCAFLTNFYTWSTHNFNVVFLIDRTTLWQEFICTTQLQLKKTVNKTFIFDRSYVLFAVLALLDNFIGIIRCHSHTPMIRHQLWFLSKSESSLNIVVNISWTLSMQCCFRLKLSNFRTIFVAARFMPKTSVKIAWQESNEMPTSSAISPIMIQQLFKIIFFTASMFSSFDDELVFIASIGIDTFSAFLKPVI